MNIFNRLLIFLDPETRKLHAENKALARSLKVEIDYKNHPIIENQRLLSIDFKGADQKFYVRFQPPTPTRTPLSFDPRSYNMYPRDILIDKR